jgi:hypothetical protein
VDTNLTRLPLFDNLQKQRTAPGNYSVLREMSPFTFAPLVTEEMSLFAQLEIELLRPEPPGHLLTQGGDIDNRMKTLFPVPAVVKRGPGRPPASVKAPPKPGMKWLPSR